MLISVEKFFTSFDMFVQFQYGLRRRIMDLYHKLFRRRILRKINQKVNNQISNEKFLNNLTSMLEIPKDINTEKNTRNLIIRSADCTANGIYNLLGSGDVVLNPIEWHTDFKTGFKWPPGAFYRNYRQEDIDSDSDVKVPRELSRSHHLLNLGLAYRLTHNEKYAAICVEQMKNWIDENPLMYSINWGCTMDVAIRAVNWIWTLGLISGSIEMDDMSAKKIKESLYQHGWFISRNPEKSPLNNGNHYLADLAGQIILGLIFSELEKPQRWLEKGKHELFREIRMEILPSGMSYERSTNYNRLVLELILVPILLLKNNKYEIPSDIWYRLEKMFEFIMFTLKPDGTIPVIGDQDNGRLLSFKNHETINLRYLLSLGALLFRRADMKDHGEGFNIYCLILGGKNALEKWRDISIISTAARSHAFGDIGLYVFRKKSDYLLFNATGKAMYPELAPGSHTHSDLFSFELFTQGKSFLIDPGSYVYTADADQRMLFRSTKMHNTVTVDGESQDALSREKIWSYGRNAIPEIIRCDLQEDLDIVTGVHNGYSRLAEPVIHQRSFIFNKGSDLWEIKDILTGRGKHKFEWFFHFDTGIDFTIDGNNVETTCEDGKNILLEFESIQGLILRKERSFVSKSYGKKEEGFVLSAAVTSFVPVELNIKILKSQKI